MAAVPQEGLPADFDLIQRLYTRLDGDDAPAAEELQAGVAVAARCCRAVREAGVMSKNESADDINTEDLKYLLADFYHGALVQQLSGPGVRPDRGCNAVVMRATPSVAAACWWTVERPPLSPPLSFVAHVCCAIALLMLG